MKILRCAIIVVTTLVLLVAVAFLGAAMWLHCACGGEV